ncbi:hypothetical protein WA1_18775 [Scytonema hofmannii PCC 7110]|uniref:ParB-like N-terminal domain-containing protein n=1 Tax=Scytonema hofmannii PCC 7110 TaxID=128403 RepID=A0A139XBG6_9CYAN|nr:ParB/RepB/Spo0J family partition protein [Scytonema hofmannii]KYC42047.1 hypothetical protein WA1_18775 [Scytonema hofmannii PCC 7110]
MTPIEPCALRSDEETRALFDPYVNEALRHQVEKLEPHPESLRIELSEIRRDGGTQPRAAINLHHVRLLEQQIIETGGEIEPVVVFYDGADYWLADGFHRWQAHHNLEKLDINCVVRQGTRRDAVLFSCGANAEHLCALARSRDDKRRAVLMLINDSEWGQWSDREIARRCKVDNKTVAKLRNSPDANKGAYLRNSSDTKVNNGRKAQRNGKSYIVDTSNIGRKTVVENETEKVGASDGISPESEAAKTSDSAEEELRPTAIERNLNEICLGVISTKKNLSPAQRWAVFDSMTDEMNGEELDEAIATLKVKSQTRSIETVGETDAT